MNPRTLRFVAAFVAASALALVSSAETIKLKFSDLAELGGALARLDGAEKQVQTDQGIRIVKVPFDLKASVRIAIARDLVAVRGALDAFEQQRQVLLQNVSPGAIQKVATDQELLARFSIRWTDYVNKNEVSLDLTLFTEADLNLDTNKEIAGTTLAGLMPLFRK